MWRWEMPNGFPLRFKAKVLAWYRLHKQVQMHSEAAVAKASETKMKRKGKGR